MAKIRFGIIGVGSRGIRTFGRHLRGAYADRAELVALADLDPNRLGIAAKMLGVDKTYGSHSQLIQDAGVDAVVITTPDYTHAEIALEAMDAGKLIICEKPVATTIDDANRLLEAGRRFGKSFQVGFVLRYAPFFKGMHAAIVDGRIGKPLFAAAVDNRAGSGYFRSWHRLRKYSGGLLNHKSGHTLDILNWMLDGVPMAVSATGGVAHYGPRELGGRLLQLLRRRGNLSRIRRYHAGTHGRAVSRRRDSRRLEDRHLRVQLGQRHGRSRFAQRGISGRTARFLRPLSVRPLQPARARSHRDRGQA